MWLKTRRRIWTGLICIAVIAMARTAMAGREPGVEEHLTWCGASETPIADSPECRDEMPSILEQARRAVPHAREHVAHQTLARLSAVDAARVLSRHDLFQLASGLLRHGHDSDAHEMIARCQCHNPGARDEILRSRRATRRLLEDPPPALRN